MLALNRSLLNREHILMNVLKALASIISMCNLHVIKVTLVRSYKVPARTVRKTSFPSFVVISLPEKQRTHRTAS
jgi:cellobiose-specific phosphotransferase system component IIC